jgi:hypothetical protein
MLPSVETVKEAPQKTLSKFSLSTIGDLKMTLLAGGLRSSATSKWKMVSERPSTTR